MRWLWRWTRRVVVAGIIVFAVAWLLAWGTISVAASGRVYHPAEAPAAPVALVLGAGVWPDGSLSVAAQNRVEAGAALYRRGAVRALLISADRRPGYDEVEPMRRAALALGVPDEAVLLDAAGFRTRLSCQNARERYGFQQALVVTQAFHLPRALYLCRAAGMEAAGVVAADFSTPYLLQATVREQAALVRAWLEVGGVLPEGRD